MRTNEPRLEDLARVEGHTWVSHYGNMTNAEIQQFEDDNQWQRDRRAKDATDD